MKKVFYSWQSDTVPKENRYFIEGILQRVAKELNHEEVDLEIRIDSDTKGLMGSPEIASSILEKIKSSDFFIADVTIVNKGSKFRKTPNPNVLFELGFAVANIGWDRIVCIQNTNYGDINDLPFDIRNHRVLAYKYDSVKKKEIEGKLNKAIKTNVSNLEIRKKIDRVFIVFTGKRNLLSTKILYVEGRNAVEKIKLRNKKEINIYKSLSLGFTLRNNTERPLKDFKIKFSTNVETQHFGDEINDVFFGGEDSFISCRGDGSLEMTPQSNLLVPGDDISLPVVHFRPIIEKGESTIIINWQIISEENFDKGIIKIDYSVETIRFEDLSNSDTIDNNTHYILTQNYRDW